MYQELEKRIKKAKMVSVSEQATINSENYRYKKRYCSKCKFFNVSTWECNKKRILRICVKENLRNVE
jgi:hypothetical protein